MTQSKAFLVAIAILFAAFSLAALPGIGDYPDNARVRSALYRGFLNAEITMMDRFAATVARDGSTRLRVSIARSGADRLALFSNESDGAFPPSSRGSWVMRKSGKGVWVSARLFVTGESDTWVYFTPDGSDRSRMELVRSGSVVASRVAVPLPFERLIVEEVETIVSMTRTSAPWELFFPEPKAGSQSAAFAAVLAASMNGLEYVDDGAMDEAGRYVYIASGASQVGERGLNCTGFLKWVVDGLLKGRGLPALSIDRLTSRNLVLRRSSLASTYEESLDPAFGLDWVRNLGLAITEALSDAERSPTARDIAIAPPSFVRSAKSPLDEPGSPVAVPEFIPNAGYSSKVLPGLLAMLAAAKPGQMYLASLSQVAKNPAVRRHYHTALLVPWLDDEGRLRVEVFESAARTSFEGFLRRQEKAQVFLVGIPSGLPFLVP